jgi:hypothetical protein
MVRDAAAGFEKVDPLYCESEGNVDQINTCPTTYQCDTATVQPSYYAFNPELEVREFSTSHTFYCPVPHDSIVDASTIVTYEISGFAPTGAASAARGCVQFTNGFAEWCESGMFPFPEGDFQTWDMPIPTNWSQTWNNAYVEVRLNGQSGGGTGASIRDIYAYN